MLSLFRSFKNFIHRRLDPEGHARKIGVKFGKGCRFINVNFGSEPYLVTLGDHVSATLTNFVTHDGGVWVFREKHPDIDVFAPIHVGNNVYIGARTIILPGVTIGDNVVIGAGAVVSRDIPSDCVAVGIPARPLKSLDEYWQHVQNKTIPAKLLNPKDKQIYLRRHFEVE